jgi:hypothetical protein
MSEHAPDRIWSGIEITKIIAGTLAAVTAAVIGSFLGVAGTLAGAAVASVVGSVGTEIYQKSLKRGAKSLSTIAPTFIKAPAAVGTPEVAAATEEDLPSHTVPEPARKRDIRWARIAVFAAGVFVLAMGAIWASEKAFGEPLSSVVTGSDSAGTTLGNTVGNNSSDDQPAITPSVAPSEAPSTGSDDDTTPTTEPAVPSTGATEPATDPTLDPTGGAPAPPTPADTGEQQDQQQQQEPNQDGAPNQDIAPNRGVTPDSGGATDQGATG